MAGAAMAPHVNICRELRDCCALTNNIGKFSVEFYYNHSPALSGVLAKHDSLKTAVRIRMLPVVGLSWAAVKPGHVFTVALILLHATFRHQVCFNRLDERLRQVPVENSLLQVSIIL